MTTAHEPAPIVGWPPRTPGAQAISLAAGQAFRQRAYLVRNDRLRLGETLAKSRPMSEAATSGQWGLIPVLSTSSCSGDLLGW